MRLSDINDMPEDPPVTMARLAEVSYPRLRKSVRADNGFAEPGSGTAMIGWRGDGHDA